MKNKLPLVIGVVIVVLLGATAFFVLAAKGKKSSQISEVTPTPVNEITNVPLIERPYLELVPSSDGHQIKMNVSRFGQAKTLEYELTYQTQGISRGVIGSAELAGQTSISKDLVMGSCSRNVCKYDEGVEGGQLILRLRDSLGVKKFVSDFTLKNDSSGLESVDKKMQINASLANTYYIVATTVGLPGQIEGQVISGPYGVFTSSSNSIKNGKVTFKMDSTDNSAKMFFWDGSKWMEETNAKLEGSQLSTSVSKLGVFVTVSSL